MASGSVVRRRIAGTVLFGRDLDAGRLSAVHHTAPDTVVLLRHGPVGPRTDIVAWFSRANRQGGVWAPRTEMRQRFPYTCANAR